MNSSSGHSRAQYSFARGNQSETFARAASFSQVRHNAAAFARFAAKLAVCACLPWTAQAEVPASPAEVAVAVGRTLAESGARQAVDLLTGTILEGRRQALAEGTAPIPSAIRRQLQAHVAEQDLEAVRWRVGGGSELSLQRNAILNGALAITLLDVVVFADEGDALADATLWAHELHHVAQYRLWGLEEFSRRYLADHTAVEAEAEAFAQSVARALGD